MVIGFEKHFPPFPSPSFQLRHHSVVEVQRTGDEHTEDSPNNQTKRAPNTHLARLWMCNVEGPPLRAKVPMHLASTDPLPIYLDHNATTPVAPEAWEAMIGCQHVWGNPSSTHPYGLDAKFVVERCREEVACALDVPMARDLFDSAFGGCLLGAKSDSSRIGSKRVRDSGLSPIAETQLRTLDMSPTAKAVRHSIVFTSCGTECNNLAIHGTIHKQKALHNRSIIVTSNVEHPATAKALDKLALEGGFEVLRVPVNAETGSIDPDVFRKCVPHSLLRRVALVTIMHANNETGSIQPIGDLINVIKEYESSTPPDLLSGRCYVHVDAAQSLGKIAFSVADLRVDLVSVVGHKFYGPKGVGALYCHPEIQLSRLIEGADHESGRRPGTENIILVAGMSRALYRAVVATEENASHMHECRRVLLDEIRRQCSHRGRCEVVVNGSADFSNCLPNTLNIAIRDVESQTYISGNRLLDEVGLKVAASAGSACHSINGDDTPITVSLPLKAIGVTIERAMGTLRLSTGKMNTPEEMVRAGRIIGKAAIQQFAEW